MPLLFHIHPVIARYMPYFIFMTSRPCGPRRISLIKVKMANQNTGVMSTPKAGGMEPLTSRKRGSVGHATIFQGSLLRSVSGYQEATTRQSWNRKNQIRMIPFKAVFSPLVFGTYHGKRKEIQKRTQNECCRLNPTFRLCQNQSRSVRKHWRDVEREINEGRTIHQVEGRNWPGAGSDDRRRWADESRNLACRQQEN